MFSQLKVQAVSAIRKSYEVLSAEQDLSPGNPKITENLTHLVRTLTQCQSSSELADFLLTTPELAAEREGLPVLCAAAECQMEKYWAKKLSQRNACDLAEFWYFPEYEALCEAELSLFKDKTFDRISFLGSGALPLTAFILARQCKDSQIICVDFDAEACELSRQLTRKVGLKDQVDIQWANASNYMPQGNELVICASLLVGRENVYKNLAVNAASALLVRDSEGVYQYLYKAAELPESNFRQISKTGLDSKRINTSRYYEQEVSTHDRAA